MISKRILCVMTAGWILCGLSLTGCSERKEPSTPMEAGQIGDVPRQNENQEGTSGREEQSIEDLDAENVEALQEAADAAEGEELLFSAGGISGDGELLSGLHHVQIDVEDYGTIQAELDADAAPITVTNFVNLANQGFYDGLTFHRIISGFMIQGGDPNGNGTGGSDESIKGEFASNGVENPIRHERGVISMARSSDPDSARSQFFIMHKNADYLDGQYAAFGHVTSGMDVVDAICDEAEPVDGNGTIPKDQQPVIRKITVLD